MPRWDEWEKTDTSKTSGAQPSKGPSAAGEVVKFAISPSLYFVEKMYRWAKKDKNSPPSPDPPRDVLVSGSEPVAVVSERSEPPTPDITCGTISIGNMDFPDWFDREFFKKPNNGLFPNSLVRKERGKKVIDCKANFHAVWDQVEMLTGKKAITLNEFVAHLMIMYNETGGTLVPVTEDGDDAYFFEYRIIEKKNVPGSGRRKATYNGTTGNRLAGEQLLAWGKISKDDVDLWNKGDRTVPQDPDADPRLPLISVYGKYPANQPAEVRMAARNCDFYKYRGRGLLQLTHFPTYQKCLDEVLRKECNGKVCEDMSNEELDEAFKKPAVYTAAFRNFITVVKKSAAKAIPGVIAGRFAAYGDAIAGGGGYGVNTFEPRCRAVRDLMRTTRYSVG